MGMHHSGSVLLSTKVALKRRRSTSTLSMRLATLGVTAKEEDV